MCLSFPGEVIAVNDVGAVVQCHDRVRRASTLLLPDIRVGEFVAVAAGTIVGRLSRDEAADLQALIEGATTPPPAPPAPIPAPTAGLQPAIPGPTEDVQ
jgi:hydrogenase maturation factor